MKAPFLTMQRLACVAITSLILLAQASVAAHNLQHQALDHTEHCQVYLTAEQASVDLDIAETEFASWSFELLISRSYPFFSPSLIPTHHSRAPPRF